MPDTVRRGEVNEQPRSALRRGDVACTPRAERGGTGRARILCSTHPTTRRVLCTPRAVRRAPCRYHGQDINQADVALMQWPLHADIPAEIADADLAYYAIRSSGSDTKGFYTGVRPPNRSTLPQWGSIRFRPLVYTYTYAPWRCIVRVDELTKSRKTPPETHCRSFS